MKTAQVVVALVALAATEASGKEPSLVEITSRCLLAEPDLATLAGHAPSSLPAIDERSWGRRRQERQRLYEAAIRGRDFGTSAELEATIRFLEWRQLEDATLDRRRRDPGWTWEILLRLLAAEPVNDSVLRAVPDWLAEARRARGESSASAWPEAESMARALLARLAPERVPGATAARARAAVEVDLELARALATSPRARRLGGKAWRELARLSSGSIVEPDAVGALAEHELATVSASIFRLLESRFAADASALDRQSMDLLDTKTRHRRLAERYLGTVDVATLERIRRRDCRPEASGRSPLESILAAALGVCPPIVERSAVDRWLLALAALLDVRWHGSTTSPGVVEDWLLRQLDEIGAATPELLAALRAWIEARPTEAARIFQAGLESAP